MADGAAECSPVGRQGLTSAGESENATTPTGTSAGNSSRKLSAASFAEPMALFSFMLPDVSSSSTTSSPSVLAGTTVTGTGWPFSSSVTSSGPTGPSVRPADRDVELHLGEFVEIDAAEFEPVGSLGCGRADRWTRRQRGWPATAEARSERRIDVSTVRRLRLGKIVDAPEELRGERDAQFVQFLGEHRPKPGGADRSDLTGGVLAGSCGDRRCRCRSR